MCPLEYQMGKSKLLIIEHDSESRALINRTLASEYDLLVVDDWQTILRLLEQERPAVAMLSLDFQHTAGQQGFSALSEMLQFDPLLKVIVVAEQNDKANAVEAMVRGAFDFLCKPFNIDELRIVLTRALYIHELEWEQRESAKSVQIDSFEGIIGDSPAIQSVFGMIRKIATTDATLLIVGEIGTGKGMAAHAIHRLSSRAGGQFVAINCSAIPENLLEAELFGHEHDSQAGVRAQRQSRIEAAQHGTLFLDEISELSPALQLKLLRFLQERQIERAGRRISVDARFVAATDIDLAKAKNEGRFNHELYENLTAVVIYMPPLRERQGDISILATALLQRYAGMHGKNLTFTQKALKAVESHEWPGNIRELENRIKRAAIMAENGRVTPEDLELTSLIAYEGKSLGQARHELERRMIEAAIARNKGNLSRTALELEISRPTLYELMDKLGISRKSA